MTRMKSYRMTPETIRMLNFLQVKTGWSETEVIRQALMKVIWSEKIHDPETLTFIKWDRKEFWSHTGEETLKAEYHLDK